MLDFTKALFLGLLHSSSELAPFAQLTSGVPAALRGSEAAAAAGAELAHLVGAERALVFPSTHHLLWDLVGGWPRQRTVIYWDRAVYPVGRWAVERAAARGVRVRAFAHHDPEDLRRRLAGRPHRPIVVTDGYCPGCGRLAPLGAYLEAVRERGGLLVLDDTQALGLWGWRRAGAPLGVGGGGSLRWAGVGGADVVWCGSLAKALGAPVAAIAASARLLADFEARSETRVHCSPASAAAIAAARRALAVNRQRGELLRWRLVGRVERLASQLGRAGITTIGGAFPLQGVECPALEPAELHRRLEALGVRTVLHRARCRARPAVSLLITVRHRMEDIDEAAAAIVRVGGRSWGQPEGSARKSRGGRDDETLAGTG